jgi:DNA-binding NarL/FixJ family response regulator
MKIGVILVDGRKMMREGLRVLLERHDDLHVAGEADEGKAGAKIAKALAPNVAVLNITFWSRDVRDMIKALSRNGKTKVICLTISHDAGFVRELLQAGAVACLTKEAAADELVTAIRTVSDGKVYLSPTVAHAVLAEYVAPTTGKSRGGSSGGGGSGGGGGGAGNGAASTGDVATLTPREREILRRIADGESSKQIAAALDIGLKTVDTHRRRLMEKLKCYSVAELTKYAVRSGLTPLETQA